MDLSAFHLKHQLRIDWSELDYFKHVNNVSFFKYVQSARVNYWEHVGLSQFHLKNNIGAILVSAHCDFKKPLLYPGTLTIWSRVNFIKTSSFGIQHVLMNDAGEISAEAKDVLVMFDFNKHEKIPVPLWLKQEIEKLEECRF